MACLLVMLADKDYAVLSLDYCENNGKIHRSIEFNSMIRSQVLTGKSAGEKTV